MFCGAMGGFIGSSQGVLRGPILCSRAVRIRAFWLIPPKGISDIPLELHGSCMLFNGWTNSKFIRTQTDVFRAPERVFA